jgi:hypothetical protein
MGTGTFRMRALSREGGFTKALRAALELLHEPRVAVVAKTQVRADFLRAVCARFVHEPETNVRTYLDGEAGQPLQETDHHLVILDASVPEDSRSVLKMLARERVPACKVIEIKKWPIEPPA